MSPIVFTAVLFAAFLHAAWNALVKSAGDKFLMTIMVASSAAFLAAVALPFLPQPDAESWRYILASALIHVGYFTLVALAYHHADMSQTYPLMRGTAPFLVALVGALALGEPLSPAAWIGISLISFGVLSMVGLRRSGDGKGAAIALCNAAVIAAYTLVDGHGVRLSGSPAGYTLWVFMLTGIPLAAWVMARHGKTAFVRAGLDWRVGLLGGLATLAAYSLVLWAMMAAPVAIVAALRETSILFGTVISAVILKENVGTSRLAAACVIVLGAIALRLG
jgi:drug/metabolite transporter (DMT)-like permease